MTVAKLCDDAGIFFIEYSNIDKKNIGNSSGKVRGNSYKLVRSQKLVS